MWTNLTLKVWISSTECFYILIKNRIARFRTIITVSLQSKVSKCTKGGKRQDITTFTVYPHPCPNPSERKHTLLSIFLLKDPSPKHLVSVTFGITHNNNVLFVGDKKTTLGVTNLLRYRYRPSVYELIAHLPICDFGPN